MEQRTLSVRRRFPASRTARVLLLARPQAATGNLLVCGSNAIRQVGTLPSSTCAATPLTTACFTPTSQLAPTDAQTLPPNDAVHQQQRPIVGQQLH